jgi:hypothetical protein
MPLLAALRIAIFAAPRDSRAPGPQPVLRRAVRADERGGTRRDRVFLAAEVTAAFDHLTKPGKILLDFG